ncbi:NAD-dependent deacetylase [Pseudoduganella sp. GCM10020061]|uniref:SIR2 family NAD-dependent protein deacylase n=1 Tax=Pseudoduganella sp. GCM10020061 TaxID=3317345 RepID=UPI00363BD0DB
MDDQVARAAQLIREADGIIVAAGAGMGVDSGLPDFRGATGFWKAYPALAAARIDFPQAASARGFEQHPRRSWGFYGHRLALYRRTVPHAGFALLQQWSRSKEHGCSVFTSNVDGQFQLAGFDPEQVHECHGSIHYMQCSAPCSEAIWPADQFMPEVDERHCLLLGELPACPHCGAIARPNILMFDDWTWLDQRSEAQSARQQAWLERLERPVVIEIGAGTAIPSVRHFSNRIIRQHNGTLVRINPRAAEVARGTDVALELGALEALRAIDRMY